MIKTHRVYKIRVVFLNFTMKKVYIILFLVNFSSYANNCNDAVKEIYQNIITSIGNNSLYPPELHFSDERVERIWVGLEDQIERMLVEHADEIEVLVERLLERRDLSNTEVLEVLGKNSLQVAEDDGIEMESVLEQIGTSVEGLEYKRKQAKVTASKEDS